jgi:hypothetical protein
LPDYAGGMVPFIYRCPITSRNVQGFFADEVPPKETETYESVTCVGLHARASSKPLNRQDTRRGKRGRQLRRPDYVPISRNPNVAGLPWTGRTAVAEQGHSDDRFDGGHPLDVRFGSKANMTPLIFDVRFTPESGHRPSALGCPLRAKSAIPPKADIHCGSQNVRLGPEADSCAAAICPYSITWSARPSSGSGIARPRLLAVFRLVTNSTLVAC